MRLRAGFLAGALVVLLLVSSVSPGVAQEETVTLTVSVVDQEGAGVADATLRASWAGGSTTPQSTAGNGKAFVDVPEGADVTVEVEHPEFVRNTPFVVNDATERDVEIPVWEKGSLAVTVSDGDGPLADAEVTVEKGGTGVQGTTGSDGTYRTGDIEVGEYTLSVVKPRYVREEVDVTIDGDVTRDVELETGSILLAANVTDDHFSPPRPVADAEVTVERDGSRVSSVTTLENGEQEVRVPVNTVVRVFADKNGYDAAGVQLTVGETDRRVDLTIRRTPLLRLELTNDRVVSGQRAPLEVTDEYGDPVAGATVVLDGESVGETDEDGRFAVRLDEPGNYTFQARTDGMTSGEGVVEVLSGEGPTATPTAETTADETSVGAPGFTAFVAVGALVVAFLAVLAVRRRD